MTRLMTLCLIGFCFIYLAIMNVKMNMIVEKVDYITVILDDIEFED